MKNLLCVLMVVVLAGLSGSASADLVHRWSFDGDLTDSSGSGNTGTFTGTDGSYVTGKFNQAISLAAGDKVVNTSSANIPTLAADSWTMNIWLNLSASPAKLTNFAGFGNNANPRHYLSFQPDDGFYFWGQGRDVNFDGIYVADGAWHMYTMTCDGTNISGYIDGVPDPVSRPPSINPG